MTNGDTLEGNSVSYCRLILPVSRSSAIYFHSSAVYGITLVSSAAYFWIPHFVFNKNLFTHGYYSHKSIEDDRFIMIVDGGFLSLFNETNTTQAGKLRGAYNSTHSIARFEQKSMEQLQLQEYPYSSLNLEPLSKFIDIRANY